MTQFREGLPADLLQAVYEQLRAIAQQRMNVEGVVYRRIKGSAQPKAVLNLASRRGDPSAVVRQFCTLVRRAAREFSPR